MLSEIPEISKEAIEVDSLSYNKACELYCETKPGTELKEELLRRIKFLSDPKNVKIENIYKKDKDRKYDC